MSPLSSPLDIFSCRRESVVVSWCWCARILMARSGNGDSVMTATARTTVTLTEYPLAPTGSSFATVIASAAWHLTNNLGRGHRFHHAPQTQQTKKTSAGTAHPPAAQVLSQHTPVPAIPILFIPHRASSIINQSPDPQYIWLKWKRASPLTTGLTLCKKTLRRLPPRLSSNLGAGAEQEEFHPALRGFDVFAILLGGMGIFISYVLRGMEGGYDERVVAGCGGGRDRGGAACGYGRAVGV